MSITNNLVKHSKTKHIEIRHHFIRDCVEKGLIELVKVHTDNNFADLFTKAFDRSWLELTRGPSSEFSSRKRECADKQDEYYNLFDDFED
ncbi:hypothetical protein L1987_06314 [Smallanthus sonchifolius]|uniref:Uncharacterized protein n=1 Tax=Smallanthus sonchifolius TaxID=185202 RepID=A0ACB9JXZ5_9ASTR|nr:hypothetical protein L1987_06314 [Smallanthus sonchifolius]